MSAAAQLEPSPRQKAAILLVTLGAEGAAKVLKHLPADVVERLTVEMARVSDVAPELGQAVQREAWALVGESASGRRGGVDYAREVLSRALGEARAREILDRVAATADTSPFAFLRMTPPDQIYAFLRGEHPQTTALVIANLPTTELAAKVIALIPPEEQADIALRIALMRQTQPDVVKDVARVMETKLDVVLQAEYSGAGGIGSLADILNKSDRGTERNILEHLGEANPELADNVRSLLFVFEDLLKLDDRTIQLVLKDVDQKDLALSLRGASHDVKQQILRNMSQRAADNLKEEMDLMPPQRRRIVEEAQTKIVAIVRRLEEEGTITLARGDGSDADTVI